MTISVKHVNQSVILHKIIIIINLGNSKRGFIIPESDCPVEDNFCDIGTSAASLRQASSC